MKSLNQILAVGTLLGAMAIGWAIVDVTIAAPLHALGGAIESKQAEIDALVVRGQEALRVLQNTKVRPNILTSPTGATEPSALHETLRNATMVSGGNLISSQSGANGEVLIRARFEERALLEFTRSVEAMPGNLRFQTFEVQPVPDFQGTITLEMTAMILPQNSNAN